MESSGNSTKNLASGSKQPIQNQFGLGSSLTSDVSSVRNELSKISGKRIEIVDEVLFQGPVTFAELPYQGFSILPLSNTTPSALNITRFKAANFAATSITNFLFGQDGQEIKILGDGSTTITHGTFIKTNTAANKLLVVDKVYTFTLFSVVWIENA